MTIILHASDRTRNASWDGRLSRDVKKGPGRWHYTWTHGEMLGRGESFRAVHVVMAYEGVCHVQLCAAEGTEAYQALSEISSGEVIQSTILDHLPRVQLLQLIDTAYRAGQRAGHYALQQDFRRLLAC